MLVEPVYDCVRPLDAAVDELAESKGQMKKRLEKAARKAPMKFDTDDPRYH